jgi:DNA polymerase-4
MIACVIIDDFPAAAARLMRYRQQAVAVVARQRVVARTPCLASRGLRIGEAQHRAAALFPQATFVEREAHIEQAAWAAMLERCHMLSPYIADAGYGIAFLDVDRHQDVLDLCTELDARAGMGTTRTAALLAALRAGIGSVRIVGSDTLASMLADWPVELLAGLHVQAETIERLHLFGLHTLAHLQQLTRRHLEAQFGSDGVAIHALLAGIGDHTPIPMYQPPPAIEYITYLDPAQREPAPLQQALRHTVDIATAALGPRHCGMLELRVTERGQQTTVRASRLLKAATNDARHLHTVATILLRDVVAPQRYCTSIAVTLRHLRLPAPAQLDLFAAAPCALDVARILARRFPHALRRVNLHTPDAYLPELSHTLVPWTLSDATDP